MEPLKLGVHSTPHITGTMATRPVFTQGDSALNGNKHSSAAQACLCWEYSPHRAIWGKAGPTPTNPMSPGWQASANLDLSSAWQTVIITQLLNRFLNTWFRTAQVNTLLEDRGVGTGRGHRWFPEASTAVCKNSSVIQLWFASFSCHILCYTAIKSVLKRP